MNWQWQCKHQCSWFNYQKFLSKNSVQRSRKIYRNARSIKTQLTPFHSSSLREEEEYEFTITRRMKTMIEASRRFRKRYGGSPWRPSGAQEIRDRVSLTAAQCPLIKFRRSGRKRYVSKRGGREEREERRREKWEEKGRRYQIASIGIIRRLARSVGNIELPIGPDNIARNSVNRDISSNRRRRNVGSCSIKYSRSFGVISSGDKKEWERSNPSAWVKRRAYLHTFISMSCIIGDIVIIAKRHRYHTREPQLRGSVDCEKFPSSSDRRRTQLYGEDLLQLDGTSFWSSRR